MAKMIIKVNVAYPGKFHKVFDAQEAARSKHGGGTYESGVDESCFNDVYVILDWDSIHSAKVYWSSPEAKDQMKDWESADTPEIVILLQGS